MIINRRSSIVAILLAISSAHTASSAAPAVKGAIGASPNASVIPITGPTTITENGYYLLEGDFTITSGNGIEIGAREVTVDLGGHKITNEGTGAAVTAHDNTPGKHSIRVTNGSIVGGGFGVSLTLNRESGLAATELDHLDIAAVAQDGILLVGYEADGSPTESAFIHNNAISGGANGIVVFAVRGGEIKENVVQGCSSIGIFVDGGSYYERIPEVRNNLARQCGTGIVASFTFEGVVEDNKATANITGFNLGDYFNGTFRRNEASSNTADGLSTYDVANNLIESNVTSRNGEDGLDLDGLGVKSNRVYSNVSTNNAGCGIISEYNILAGNVLFDNGKDLCP